MRSRRAALTQLAAVVAGGAAVWWLRDQVVFPTPRPRFTLGDQGSGWLSFLGPGLVAVPALAAGQAVGALIDSGAQTSVLDRAAAERLGVTPGAPIPMLAYGVTGGPQMGRSGAVDVALGALALPGLHVALLDLAPIVEATDGRVELVLGQDLLRRVVADLDFPNGRLALRPPDAPSPGALSPLPTRMRGRELTAPVMLEGHALQAVVDTGSSAALAVSEAAARAAGLLAPGRSSVVQPGVTFGGASAYRVVTAARFSWAGQPALSDVPVQVFHTPAASALAPDALLGVGAMQARRLSLRLGAGELDVVGPAAAAVGLTR
ncbi:MAG: retroviral-like aspartic protease family protein [Caulobacteraceae bacterium]|nr:retroviral-like aspartic protease family protein [Caulobacter sp.]